MLNQQKLAKKIKKIREEHSLSQENFAKKIGLSRVAVSQLEVGKRGLNALELAKIAKVLGVSVDFLLQEEKEEFNRAKNINREIKMFKVEKDKLKNAILYILEKCGGKPNIGETVLYKLLYFLDFDNYELYGKPITGMSYIKLQYGPVPIAGEYNFIIEKMVKNNELKIISQDYHGLTQKRYIALTDVNTSVFGGNEINTMDEIISRLSDMNANQIEEYVHGDAPWQIAEEKQIIPYELVFEREAPYAHRDYEQLWQDAAGADTLKELGPMSNEEYNYYKNL